MKRIALLVTFLITSLSFLNLAIGDQPNWKDLYNLSQNSYRIGQMAQSLLLAKDSLKQAEREFGPNSIYEIKSLALLGDLCRQSGSYAESLRYYKRGVDLQRIRFGIWHPNTAHLINQLGNVDLAMGNYDDAKRLFEEALEICEKTGDSFSPFAAESLIGLSELEKLNKNYEAAVSKLSSSLAILDSYSKYQPRSRVTLAKIRIQLADNLKAQGKHKECCKEYRLAIQRLENNGESTSSIIADALVAMGDAYTSCGKKARALDCYKKALAIFVNDSPNNLGVAMVSRRLAEVYKSNGNLSEARRFYRQAVSSLEMCSPSGCPLLADTQKSLNDLLKSDNLRKTDTAA